MPIDLKQTVLLSQTPLRDLFKLEGSPLDKLIALNSLFRESEKTDLQCLLNPDPSFLPPGHYRLMDYLIDSLKEETANPEEQKTLLVNTIFFMSSNKATLVQFNPLNYQQFFSTFFTLHTLLDTHKASWLPAMHTKLHLALFDMANDYIKKIDLNDLTNNTVTLSTAFHMNQLSIQFLINWIKTAKTQPLNLPLKASSFTHIFMTIFSFLSYASQQQNSRTRFEYKENLITFFNLFFKLQLLYSFEELGLNSPDQLITLLRLAKECHQEESHEEALCMLTDFVFEYILNFINDSHYASVAFELILNYPLFDLQLAKLIFFKEAIKTKIKAILDNDNSFAQKELIKQTFYLDNHNQQSKLHLFFMLQQTCTYVMLAENNYKQFKMVDALLNNKTTTLCMMREMAAKHPDLILEIILNSKDDYQLFLLSDSKIKMAVVNHIIDMAKPAYFTNQKWRDCLADLLAAHENKSVVSEENTNLYRYFAIPQESNKPVNGISLNQDQNTTSLKLILSEARKYQTGAHLSTRFQIRSSEPCLVQPFYDSHL